ncbi:MAG: hypothetical protein K9G58_13355 [Bacteroidales bacterium]|nr:hypothetical protein [Bacteroidales bacterium]MCF8387561.1 hypothetical protein [Bacteroidales bacterium]MCF8399157.1 hypothetical protein [Bacteroidales bacterium]
MEKAKNRDLLDAKIHGELTQLIKNLGVKLNIFIGVIGTKSQQKNDRMTIE